MSDLPYRPNVGAMLFNAAGLVFVGRRADIGAWQMPQGGIDGDEDPRAAVLRELQEEIGTDKARIIDEHEEWLSYDLPAAVLGGTGYRGRYRGQRQRWFALRFTGVDGDIRLDADAHQEFDAWRWAPIGELPGLAVAFKRPIYEDLARRFARHAVTA